MNNARRKLEIPMPAVMLCKTPMNGRGETCRSIGKRKTKYACVVEADESMETVKIFWGRQRLRTSTLTRERRITFSNPTSRRLNAG